MDELYQSQILHLARVVRASTEIAHPTHHAHVKNTVCGDEINLHLHLKDDKVTAIHIAVDGCAVCEAGAGLLYDNATGVALSDMAKLAESLDAFLSSQDDHTPSHQVLAPFTPVREVKNRHKCVTLAFSALAAIKPLA